MILLDLPLVVIEFLLSVPLLDQQVVLDGVLVVQRLLDFSEHHQFLLRLPVFEE
jgi:hypothetical protein